MADSILIVDDERGIRETLRAVLEDEGFDAVAVASGEECLRAVKEKIYSCILLDVWLPGIDGLDTLERLESSDFGGSVVMISGHGNIETAVRATKLGAFDFIEKPLSIEKTLLTVRNALRQHQLERTNTQLEAELSREYAMVGDSVAMRALRKQISIVAPTDGRVLIYGESGTGKELVARAIHGQSRRTKLPFVEVNSAAIPEELVEAELFGNVKGAFTGAHRQRLGKFELANRGTLFLDEIADLSQHAQVALLRAIQQREITRVGGEHTIPVDARIITASHQSLPRLVRESKFRADLLFRLNHLTIYLPPLRDRKDDLEVLSQAFLSRLKLQLNRSISGLSQGFLEKLRQHSWPGNVRELEHVLRQAAILEDASLLTGRFFQPIPRPTEFVPSPPASPPRIPKTSRHRAAKEAVEAAQGNKSYAAASLGISRKTLYSWLNSTG